MPKLRVALVFGGKSGEHEVSIVSALSIYKALDKSKYEITLVGIDKSGRWTLPDAAALVSQAADVRKLHLDGKKNAVTLLSFPAERNLIAVDGALPPDRGCAFDVVLPILHGTNGEDGTVQGLLDLAGLPYAGSGVLGSAACMDKELAKRLLRDAGMPVVPFLALRKHEFERDRARWAAESTHVFGLPFFVKPSNLGSSVGVHKVRRESDAAAALEDAFRYDTKVLVEKAIEGRELEVAVLGNHDPRASVVGEIIPRHEFYSYEAKYVDEHGADLKIPADHLPEGAAERARNLAIAAFRALECAGMARVDFFLETSSGQVFLNEVNTIPGFTSISMYPKLWEASGVPYPELLDRLIDLALERHRERAALKTSYTSTA